MEVNLKESVLRLGMLLQEYKAESVVVLDLRSMGIWTEYFIIATISSARQANGMERKIMEESCKLGIEQYRTIKKSPDGDEWKLLDFGNFVIHLMSPTARRFYDLERLWFESPRLMG